MTMPAEHTCIHEERFARIESEQATLNARMASKKDDLYNINKQMATDRQQQIELIEKVTEVTVLLRASQKSRDENNKDIDKKFKDLEDKFDKVSEELSDTKEQLTDFVASQRSFRNTVAIGAPIIISIIVGVIFKFI